MSGFIELIQYWVRAQPDSLACADDRRSLSYGELDVLSSLLASNLRTSGVSRSAVVGILLPRSVDFIVSILATIKAGAAYLPLDLGYPADRLTFMMEDSGASTLICDDENQDLAATLGVDTLSSTTYMSMPTQRLAGTRHNRFAADIKPNDACYLIYTSGTTGKPKGVVVEHRNLDHMLAACGGIPELGPNDRVMQFSSVSFDASVFEIFLALTAGASLLIPDRDTCLGPSLIDTINRLEITVAVLPPSLLAAVLPLEMPRLRMILSAGEALSKAVALPWSRVTEVWNGYGPTESAVCSATSRFDVSDPGLQVPLGKPIAGTEIYLLRPDGSKVRENEVGEIFIGGCGVARGYVGNPSLTSERFRPDPFSNENGARMYRTGDFGSWRSDGQLEFKGRSDRQVKVRGHRVEVEEIEAALASLEGVRQAVVAAAGANGPAQLVAFVVADDIDWTAATIRHSARRLLPEFMIPTVVHIVDHIPVTPAGKSDVEALVAFHNVNPPVPPTATASTDIPGRIGVYWHELLDYGDFGENDNFFELGGDSLIAATLLSRYLADGYDMSYTQFISAPTINEHAAFLEKSRAVPAYAGRPGVPTSEPIPITPQQLQIWILGKLYPASNAYISQVLLNFQRPISVNLLQKSLAALVRRHDILRMAIVDVDDVPWQRVCSDATPSLTVIDAGSANAASAAAEFSACIQHERSSFFDLRRPPLMRWCLFRYKDGSCSLLQTEHHLVHDGWSSILLIRDLAELYTAETTKAKISTEYGSFANYALGLQDQRDLEQRLAESVAAALGDTSISGSLPLSKTRPRRRGRASEIELSTLDQGASAKVRRTAAKFGVTPYTIFLASFALAFREVSGLEEFVVGCGVANRKSEMDWRTAGMFVNVVPIRLRLPRQTSKVSVIHHCSEALGFALDHARAPFLDVLKHLKIERNLGRNPVYEVILSNQEADPGDLSFGDGNPAILEEIVGGMSKADLTVIGFTGKGARSLPTNQMRYAWQYDSDIIAADTVNKLSELTRHYQTAAFD